MTSKKSRRKLTTYIGRFSLWHNGHAAVALRALRLSDKVLIIVGSAKQPRTIKNPWKADERAEMIRAWYLEEFKKDNTLGELVIETNRDYMYSNDMWLSKTQEIINKHAPQYLEQLAANPAVVTEPIYITGSNRDDSTFYLKLFPRPTYELDLVAEDVNVSKFLSATWCREIYLARTFEGNKLSDKAFELLMSSFVPPTTLKYLKEFATSEHYTYLVEAWEKIKTRQKELFGKYGFHPSVTADSVVVQSGHILLVKRRAHPGKGLWALPGGYVEVNDGEWTFEAALRELDEETMIKVPPAVLRNSVKFDHWFQHPNRSDINRVFTNAFCFKLPDHIVDGQVQMPKVTAADDAVIARWTPIAEALEMSEVLFDDHHAIIEDFVARLRKERE